MIEEDEYASRVDLTLVGTPDVDVRGEGEVATATTVILRAFHKSRHNYDVFTRRRSERYCALLDGPAQI